MRATQSVPAIEDSGQGRPSPPSSPCSPASSSSTCPWKPPRWTTTCPWRRRRCRSAWLTPSYRARSTAQLMKQACCRPPQVLPLMQVGVPGAEQPWARAAQEVGNAEGGDWGRISSEPGGSRRPRGTKLSRCLLCAPPGCPHTDCDCSSGQSPAELATPGAHRRVGGCGLEGLLKALQLRTVRAVVHEPALTLHFFPHSVLAAPVSVCPPSSCLSTTSSGTSSSSSSAMRIPGKIVPSGVTDRA